MEVNNVDIRTPGGVNTKSLIGSLILVALAILVVYFLIGIFNPKEYDRTCLEDTAKDVCHNVFSTYNEQSLDIEKERFTCTASDGHLQVEFFTIAEMKGCLV